ncbi:MAG: protocatechuate 3,4-dioxygenase [Planctomycetota bacterium]
MLSRRQASRRRFLAASGAAAGGMVLAERLWTTPGAFAEELEKTLRSTPWQTEGPFYPDKLPLDTDNDLLRLNDRSTPALGEVTHLTGRVLSVTGEPVRGATVEIWQCDANGNYLHSRGASNDNRDEGFQGFGRFLTDSQGRYYFRTIKPVPYPGRTPHIHIAVDKGDKRVLTTQCYIKDFAQNARDGVMRSTTAAERELLMVPWEKLEGSAAGEWQAKFDLVLGSLTDEGADRNAGGRRMMRRRRG